MAFAYFFRRSERSPLHVAQVWAPYGCVFSCVELERLRSLACNVLGGRYRYMADLFALQACVRNGHPLPAPLATVTTPVVLDRWVFWLAPHPDRSFAEYICKGFREGFRIGFASGSPLRVSGRNLRSATAHAEVVDGYLYDEVRARRMLPLDASPYASRVHVSPFGVLPKPHQPGRWRLIVDLSAPAAASVNDGVDRRWCSLRYASIDDAVDLVRLLGPDCLLAKLDLRASYRVVPVHPDDRCLLGVRWKGAVYLDAALPFGLRSAPKIFSAVADALLWIMFRAGVTVGLHYLDDFLVLGRAGKSECARNLERALAVCKVLGVPVAMHKVEGPASTLTFLGIEFDTVAGVLRLPEDKLHRLRSQLTAVAGKRACTKRELLSLVGLMHHASLVVRPGRSFVRRLLDLAHTARQLDRFVRLNQAARADIAWWLAFAASWNGVGLASTVGSWAPSLRVQSDASGCWGYGAVAVSSSPWRGFASPWSLPWRDQPIAPKELYPVLVAAVVWGPT